MILFLSLRYAFSSSKALRARTVRIAVTTMLSLVVVISVISIMDALQSGQFDAIRNTRSFDYVIEGDVKDEISSLVTKGSVFVYGEGEAITESGAYLVRYIDSSYEGKINYYIGDSSSLLVPMSFYRSSNGGTVTLYMLKTGEKTRLLSSESFTISGIYYTELGSEFDDSMLFLPLDNADINVVRKTALKGISDREKDLLTRNGYTLISWKDSESGIYGAFALEKGLMYGVLSMLFIIIAVSLKSSVALFFSERLKEMAELEILGLGRKSIKWTAILSFLIVILIGIASSLLFGKLTLIIIERITTSSPYMMTLSLHMPFKGFMFFSLLMVVLTFVFASNENKKREKRDLIEVIYEH